MQFDLDLRVLAVVAENGQRVYTLRNAEAQRRAVYMPLSDIIGAYDTVTDKITHVPIEYEGEEDYEGPDEDIEERSHSNLTDAEFIGIVNEVLHWITHGKAN